MKISKSKGIKCTIPHIDAIAKCKKCGYIGLRLEMCGEKIEWVD